MIETLSASELLSDQDWVGRILDTIPDQIYVKDTQCRFLMVNAACARFFNFPAAGLIGKTDYDFFPASLAEQFHAEEMNLLQSGTPVVNREARVCDQMGRARWVVTNKMPLRNAGGEILGLVGLNRDITARKVVDDQVRLQAAALKAAASGVVITDKDGVIQWANPAFTRITGYALDEVIGHNPRIFKSGAHEAAYYRQLWETIQGGQVWRGEIINRHKDGRLVVEDMSITPVRDHAGAITHFIAIRQDVTERKRAQDQLHQLNADLARSQLELLTVCEELQLSNDQLRRTQAQLVQAEKLESIGRLAAGIAHEVKNPLAILLMGVGYLDDAVPADAVSVLASMRDAVERADAIVHELLDFASPRQLELAPVSLNDLIERALLLVRHELLQRGIVVVRELAPQLPVRRVDRIRIEQVFVNLFTNAAHAMPAGGTLTVQTRAAADGAVVAQILDTGTGIAPEHVSKVFDPFFTTKPVGVGSGMGLAVARNILQQHHGELTLANRPTGGAVATVVFHNRKETANGSEESPHCG
jgi:PAS domain S-box-containing protein